MKRLIITPGAFDQALKKIHSLIAKSKNDQVIDKALDLHSRLVSESFKFSAGATNGTPGMLAIMQKSEGGTLPSVDTRKSDARFKEQRRQQDGPDEPEKKKDDRPLSPFAWKVRMPNGKTYGYKLSQNGTLTTHEVGEYRVPTYTLEQFQKLHSHIEAHRQEITKDQEKTTMAKSQDRPQQRWGAQKRLWGTDSPAPAPARAATTPPAPPAQDDGRRRWGRIASRLYDPQPQAHGQLSGAQMAAVKAGLSPNEPDLHTLTFEQMKERAHNQAIVNTQPMREKAGICLTPDGAVIHKR